MRACTNVCTFVHYCYIYNTVPYLNMKQCKHKKMLTKQNQSIDTRNTTHALIYTQNTQTQTHTHAYIHVCKCIYIRVHHSYNIVCNSVSEHMYTPIRTCTHAHINGMSVYMYVYVSVHVYMYTHIHITAIWPLGVAFLLSLCMEFVLGPQIDKGINTEN